MRISRGSGNARAAAAAVAVVAILVTASPAHPAAAASPALAASALSKPRPSKSPAGRAPTVPELTISISDGRKSVRVGERLTYTVRVSDSGAKQEPRLKITQTLPTGLRFVSASHGGLVAGNQVSWHAGVSAGGTDSFSLVALVTRLRAGVGRLASVACATVRGSSRPLVCAADLNRLPAATAAAAAAEVRQPAGGLSRCPC